MNSAPRPPQPHSTALRNDLEKANASYARARELIGDPHSAQRAVELVSEAIALRPRIQRFYVLRGFLLRQMGDLERAVLDQNAAIRLGQRSAAARCGRGLCFRRLGRWSDALTDLDDAVELSGGDARYRYYRGLVLADLRRWEDAAEEFAAAAAAGGRAGPRYAYRARLSRAKCLEELGRLSAALAELDALQRQFPALPDASACAAVLLLHLGRPQEALLAAQAALARGGHSAAAAVASATGASAGGSAGTGSAAAWAAAAGGPSSAADLPAWTSDKLASFHLCLAEAKLALGQPEAALTDVQVAHDLCASGAAKNRRRSDGGSGGSVAVRSELDLPPWSPADFGSASVCRLRGVLLLAMGRPLSALPDLCRAAIDAGARAELHQQIAASCGTSLDGAASAAAAASASSSVGAVAPTNKPLSNKSGVSLRRKSSFSGRTSATAAAAAAAAATAAAASGEDRGRDVKTLPLPPELSRALGLQVAVPGADATSAGGGGAASLQQRAGSQWQGGDDDDDFGSGEEGLDGEDNLDTHLPGRNRASSNATANHGQALPQTGSTETRHHAKLPAVSGSPARPLLTSGSPARLLLTVPPSSPERLIRPASIASPTRSGAVVVPVAAPPAAPGGRPGLTAPGRSPSGHPAASPPATAKLGLPSAPSPRSKAHVLHVALADGAAAAVPALLLHRQHAPGDERSDPLLGPSTNGVGDALLIKPRPPSPLRVTHSSTSLVRPRPLSPLRVTAPLVVKPCPPSPVHLASMFSSTASLSKGRPRSPVRKKLVSPGPRAGGLGQPEAFDFASVHDAVGSPAHVSIAPCNVDVVTALSVPSWAAQLPWPETPLPFSPPCDVPRRLAEDVSRVHAALGVAYHALGHLERAREHLENAAMAWPLLLAARFHLGVVLGELAERASADHVGGRWSGLPPPGEPSTRDQQQSIGVAAGAPSAPAAESVASLVRAAMEQLGLALALTASPVTPGDDSGAVENGGSASRPISRDSNAAAARLAEARACSAAVESSVALLQKRGFGLRAAALRALWLPSPGAPARSAGSSLAGSLVPNAAAASTGLLSFLKHTFSDASAQLKKLADAEDRIDGPPPIASAGRGGSQPLALPVIEEETETRAQQHTPRSPLQTSTPLLPESPQPPQLPVLTHEQMQQGAVLHARAAVLTARAQAWQALASCSSVIVPTTPVSVPVPAVSAPDPLSLLSPEACHMAAVRDLSAALDAFADPAVAGSRPAGDAALPEGRVRYLRAVSLLALHRPRGAAQDCRVALGLGCDSRAVRCKLAQALAYVGDWEASSAEYDAALAAAPGDAALLRGRAGVRRAQGRADEALADLSAALLSHARAAQEARTPLDPFRLATARAGSPRSARPAVLLAPAAHALVLVDRAQLYLDRGSVALAVTDFKAALSTCALSPAEEAQARYGLGLAFANAGEITEAIDAFTSAIDLAQRVQETADSSCRPYRRSLRQPSPLTLGGLKSGAERFASAMRALTLGSVASAPTSQPGADGSTTATASVMLSAESDEPPLAQAFQALLDALLAESTERRGESSPVALFPSPLSMAQRVQSPALLASPVSESTPLSGASYPTSPGVSGLTGTTERLALCEKLAFRFSRALLKIRSVALVGEVAALETAREMLRLRILATHERAKQLQLGGRHADAVADFTDVLVNAPSTKAAFFRRGLSLRALRCFACAADDLETARAMLPRDERFNVNYHALQDIKAVVVSAAGEEPPCAIVGLPPVLRIVPADDVEGVRSCRAAAEGMKLEGLALELLPGDTGVAQAAEAH